VAESSRKTSGYTVLTVSMALLVVGLGLGGPMGILLNVAAIIGCVISIVLLAGAKSAEPGPDADRRAG
jgi:hypothetical protein